MANVTYKVVKGDTLSEIAVKYNTTVKKLQELNDIDNPDLIYAGQTLIISGTAVNKTTTTKTAKTVTVKHFGLMSNSDRDVFVTWVYDRDYVDHYNVQWSYYTGDGVWFKEAVQTTTASIRQSVYTAKANATAVKVTIKPIAKKHTKNGKEVYRWTNSDWCTAQKYSFSANPPSVPTNLSIKIDQYKLTVEADYPTNAASSAKTIEFQIYKNDSKKFDTGKATIKTSHATYSCTVDAGAEYKFRCRAIRDEEYSDWSDWSSSASSGPAAPGSIKKIKATSSTSVTIDWANVSNCDGYEVEYTTKKGYFDSNTEAVTSKKVDSVVGHAEITGLEAGNEYFFRVRATTNDNQYSDWSEIVSIVVGKKPSAPTTWASSTVITTGTSESLTLYWIHNSEDASAQTEAEVEITVNGVANVTNYVTKTDEDEEERTYSHDVDLSTYKAGAKILWRVRTKGVLDEWSDWSVQRTVDIYSPPTLTLTVPEIVTSFPIHITGEYAAANQIATGYHISITSNETYETVDYVGNAKIVKSGEEVYSKYFDIHTDLDLKLYPSDIDLANNVTYAVTCTLSMNSGLTVTKLRQFDVAWTEAEYGLNAEIGIDPETLIAYICPYCEDTNGNRLSNLTMAVYRREYDGSFTEIATDINSGSYIFVTDPHPALDYARYRIVGIDGNTGAISYYDVVEPVGEKSIIIQWAEAWSNFMSDSADVLEDPPWAGSMLKLPYNIDVSESYDKDVELVNYIGREQPVSYYGTHITEAPTWNVDIDKRDEETIYALRRLAKWMGDVYVREPSGVGYWATISVSFPQKHLDLTAPITLSITRVTGGV